MATTFRKPKRNFRKKVANSDSDQEQNEEIDSAMDTEDSKHSFSFSGKEKKKKGDIKKVPSAALLSFGDNIEEDDAEVFKIKKSSHSKRIVKQLKKESEKEKTGDDKVPNGEDEVAKPKLAQRELSKEDHDEKLRLLREEFRTLNGDEAAALDEESDDETRMFKAALARGEIPNATTIHLIRKQRQIAREMGDFLPLEENAPSDGGNSRLVREDDNDRSDDDEEGRIDFTVNTEARERKKMQEEFLAAEHGSDQDSDQEREWEEQQIKKAVNMQQVASNPDLFKLDDNAGLHSSAFSIGNQGNIDDYHPTETRQHPTFQPFAQVSKLADTSQITIDSIQRKLKERLDSMDEVCRSHQMERTKLITDIEDTEKSISTCEMSTADLENRFRFFQEMRGYVRDLVECLNEKVPVINELESRLQNLLRGQAEALIFRRQQDVRDQCQDYMTSKAQVVMEAGEDLVRQRRVAEREARRSRRRRAREAKNIVGHHEGLSSDDEENQSEITKCILEREDISNRSQQLFEDVVEDFSQMDFIRDRFHEWKDQYGATYREAYIGLCLPKLLNPLVRLQLLSWNPLENNCRDFEETRWYESLLFYGFHEDSDIDIEDEDVKLLPSIVEKILLPKLTYLVEYVWDPMSTTETARLVKVVEKMCNDYPTINPENKNTQVLFKAIGNRMKKTLDDDVFLPLYPKTVIDNRNSGPAIFFHRQSWTCIKLLGNILSWHGIISDTILRDLALNGLLNRYIILGLMNSVVNQETLTKCQAVVSTFPKQWFSELEGDQTVPQLENLCRYLIHSAAVFDKMGPVQESDRKDARELMKQVSKLLVNIHALDHAMVLAKQYSLRINQ